jgi:uncharacterized protein (DUF169 family)
MNLIEIAKIWEKHLSLTQPIVAIAFLEHPPEKVARSSEAAPSACTFWRRGQQQLFYATAEDHENCPIGLMTMGFPMTTEKGSEAESLIGTMANLHYFNPAEVAHIQTIKKSHQVVVYGPLPEFPTEPDQILLLLTPYQMMIAIESLGGATWAENQPLGTFGRPACAALPKAEQLNSSTISLGCIGARTYTNLPHEEMLLVVPAAEFAKATEQLAKVANANQQLACFHNDKKRTITMGT